MFYGVHIFAVVLKWRMQNSLLKVWYSKNLSQHRTHHFRANRSNRLSELHWIKGEFGMCNTVYCINISVLQCTRLISSLPLSQMCFLFLCMISLINRHRHDRDLFYKEQLSLSDMLCYWPELILMVDMVNTVPSILETLTLLETFQDRTRKKMLHTES